MLRQAAVAQDRPTRPRPTDRGGQLPHAVILYYDPPTEARLQRLTDAVNQAGAGSPNRESGIRPHITLDVFSGPLPPSLPQDLAALAAGAPRIETYLSTVSVFPGAEGVVFIGPSPTQELVALQAAVRLLLERPAPGDGSEDDALSHVLTLDPYTTPGLWYPHTTLAMGLDQAQVRKALEISLASDVYGPARLTQLCLVQFYPVVEVWRGPLGAAGSDAGL